MWLPVNASPFLDILIPLLLIIGGIPGAPPGADMGYPFFACPPNRTYTIYQLSVPPDSIEGMVLEKSNR
jgi:hypothetical protein